MKKYSILSDYIEALQKQGRYLFEKQAAIETLKLSEDAFKSSLKRLSLKKKVAYLKKGLYQIIPLVYEDRGSLPPEWFIDELMAYLGVPYYVGLLSAAAFHGAAHQAPQIFQVVCSQPIPPLNVGEAKICFYSSQKLSHVPTQKFKTPAGYMKVSTPEGTAFDLLRYLHASGHLNHVATVLNELAEEISPEKLTTLAPHFSVVYAQRLGYLLEFLGYSALAEPLAGYLKPLKPLKYTPLRPDGPPEHAEKDKRWHLFINETVEPDA